MPIQPTVDTLDAVDESLRGGYVESANGGFEFDPLKYAESVKAPLVAKNKELLTWKTQNKDKVSRAEKLADLTDEDYEEFKQIKEAKANGGGNQNDERVKLTKAISEATGKVKAEYETKLKELEGKLTATEQQYRNDGIKAALVPAMVAEGFKPGRAVIDTAEKYLSRFEKQGDKLIPLEEDGTPSHLSAAEAIRSWIAKEYPELIGADTKGGSGAPPNAGRSGAAGSKTMTRAAFDALGQAGRMQAAKDGVQIVD